MAEKERERERHYLYITDKHYNNDCLCYDFYTLTVANKNYSQKKIDLYQSHALYDNALTQANIISGLSEPFGLKKERKVGTSIINL